MELCLVVDIQEGFLEKETFQLKFKRRKLILWKRKGEFQAERTENAESLKWKEVFQDAKEDQSWPNAESQAGRRCQVMLRRWTARSHRVYNASNTAAMKRWCLRSAVINMEGCPWYVIRWETDCQTMYLSGSHACCIRIQKYAQRNVYTWLSRGGKIMDDFHFILYILIQCLNGANTSFIVTETAAIKQFPFWNKAEEKYSIEVPQLL